MSQRLSRNNSNVTDPDQDPVQDLEDEDMNEGSFNKFLGWLDKQPIPVPGPNAPQLLGSRASQAHPSSAANPEPAVAPPSSAANPSFDPAKKQGIFCVWYINKKSGSFY